MGLERASASAGETPAARPAPVLYVTVLGPVEAWLRGVRIGVSAAKHRMILAALALRAGEIVSTDQLIDRLWGEDPPATARKALQVYVSELRRLLAPDGAEAGRSIVNRPPGYGLDSDVAETDLAIFERRWQAGRDALHRGDMNEALHALREGVALWRGEPLADLVYERAFAADAQRLEEMRVACLEDQLEAELALGHHAAVVGQLEQLVASHPFRERLRGQLMRALYGAGRQADALAAYQHARETLVDSLGIDPSPALVKLERQILQQDPELDVAPASRDRSPVRPAQEQGRALLVTSQRSGDIDALIELARALVAGVPSRELLIARVLTVVPGRDLSGRLREATDDLAARAAALQSEHVPARSAVFASRDPANDLAKLATYQDVDFLLLDGTRAIVEGRGGLADEVLDAVTCDVGLYLPREAQSPGGDVLVPFSGSDHDWAALELATLVARQLGLQLVLAGADARAGEEANASRLLANASFVLQRAYGVGARPLLVPPGPTGVLHAAGNASLIAVGLSPRFRTEGLGESRHAIAQRAPAPVVFVRRGTRPGPLAPATSMTRFAWSVASGPAAVHARA